MKRVMRWRYYCDHCPKSGSSGGHMKKHEAGCVRNPERVCGMCREAELDQKAPAELDAVLENEGLDALRTLADGCPACMLAAVIRARLKYGPASYEPDTGATNEPPGAAFSWTVERERFWRDVNEEACSRA